ncbi:MAG: hypothetical protein GY950_14845 [bacterium]|nr:hypothetical protein [bacterium]
MRRRQSITTTSLFFIFFVFMYCFGMQAADFTIRQTLSDEAQRNTIAFDGLAFLTGDLCSDTFIPPGKVADFFGFQYLRDNDSDQMGHNTDFLTRISNNVLYILTDSQMAELIAMAEEQVADINNYGYMRFPLIKAFRRLLEGDVPDGCDGLDKQAVMDYSAQLYRLDGEISYRRAEVIGGIIRGLDQAQRAYLDGLAAVGMLSWPEVGDQLDARNYDHDVHVAIMTYASQLFSWYAGSVEADTYFCPERQGTYFGSFYLKDMPAMGNPGYSIDPNLTANKGAAFLGALTDSQAELVSGLVDIQRDDLYAIVDRRTDISTLLRGFMTADTVDKTAVLALAETYGELDGEIVYNYATRFAQVNGSLSSGQTATLMTLRDLDDYPCSGAYLYSESIPMPDIIDTDFLFTGDSGGGGGEGNSPELTLSRTGMEFGIVKDTGTVSGAQTFSITNSGTGTLNWTVSADAAWVVVGPTAGTGTGVVTVTIDDTGLAVGPHSASLEIRDPDASNSPRTLTVSLKVFDSGTTTGPFGEFAAIGDGSPVRSSIAVSGWALDDIGIESVTIYRMDGAGRVLLGDAVFVEGARPDIENAYPGYPFNYRAGWGYMLLTNFLPGEGNGTYYIRAIAADVEGNEVVLGTQTIVCDNADAVKPFGAIDTPAQGGIASGGTYRNHGWVLTPMPNSIAADGSTIAVYIDGVNVGSPVYNVYRSDIAALFPGYANSNGAHAYFDFDTTAYDNGVHLIYWTAADSAGNIDGIGSRYFSVQNTNSSRSSTQSETVNMANRSRNYHRLSQTAGIPIMDGASIMFRKGFSDAGGFEEVNIDRSGFFHIDLTGTERLSVELSSNETFVLEGYAVVGNELRRLPIGSTLARESGKFYWVPGPGFQGRYHFVFLMKSADGSLSKRNVMVRTTRRVDPINAARGPY